MRDKYEPFEVECTKSVKLDYGRVTCFKKGQVYKSCFPEVWPDEKQKYALIDEQKDEHFMDKKWFNEHFKRLNDSVLIEREKDMKT